MNAFGIIGLVELSLPMVPVVVGVSRPRWKRLRPHRASNRFQLLIQQRVCAFSRSGNHSLQIAQYKMAPKCILEAQGVQNGNIFQIAAVDLSRVDFGFPPNCCIRCIGSERKCRDLKSQNTLAESIQLLCVQISLATSMKHTRRLNDARGQ